MVETQKLSGDNPLIAGAILTSIVSLAADQYYVGMPLSYNATNTNYAYQATIGSADAFYCGTPKTLTATGHGQIAVGGRIFESGIVDDSGDKITITEANRKALRAKGFYPV